MKTAYFSYLPRTHINGKAHVEIDDSELSDIEKNMLAGASEHLGEVIGYAWAWFDLIPGDLEALEKLIAESMMRIDQNGFIRPCDSDSSDEVRKTLGDFLSASVLYSKTAIDQLYDGDHGGFVEYLIHSVDCFARFNAYCDMLVPNDEVDRRHVYEAVKAHLKEASERAAKPNREIRAKALEMFRNNNYQSKNQAAEKIAPEVGRTVAVVRGWLKGL